MNRYEEAIKNIILSPDFNDQQKWSMAKHEFALLIDKKEGVKEATQKLKKHLIGKAIEWHTEEINKLKA